MNEIAVAEKLSESTITVCNYNHCIFIIEHHVLINIFNNRHTVLSQSLCDSVSIAWLLYAERMLTQEAVSKVVSASPSIPNQREALLSAVKKAVQTDPNSLHTFANVLCTISTNMQLGQAILDDISEYNDDFILKPNIHYGNFGESNLWLCFLLKLYCLVYSNYNGNSCLFIVICLGKHLSIPEVGMVPETIIGHDVVPQGII